MTYIDSDDLFQLPFDDEHVPTLFRKIKCELLQIVPIMNVIVVVVIIFKAAFLHCDKKTHCLSAFLTFTWNGSHKEKFFTRRLKTCTHYTKCKHTNENKDMDSSH